MTSACTQFAILSILPTARFMFKRFTLFFVTIKCILDMTDYTDCGLSQFKRFMKEI